ncbi:intracellular hyaluronan-binding protein 4 isoform X1 [Salvelinus sp. IW2-2015]|uniref:intracellular hyaluronan-binding protein 4 isoform X1 n=1 Tax=Salvelinus sp. IW2-2015 TaxID=2691554 RepID=UPI0038D4B38A
MKGIVEEPIDTESAGFGCAVTNRFGQLLDDEADPFDIIREAQVEKQKKKKKDEPKKTAITDKLVKKDSQKDRRTALSAGECDNAHVKSLQGPKYPQGAPGHVEERRVGFRDRRQNDSEAPLGYSIERPVDQGERPGRGRGGGRGRGMRGGGNIRSTDGFDQRGKREFERHSGSDRTGVRSEEKRGGSGPRNWGSMRDHISAAADGAAATEGGDGYEVAETGANLAPENEGEGEAVVEVAVEMSLDEWKALQEQNRPKKEFNLRKADTIVPSNSVVIHKSKKQVECLRCLGSVNQQEEFEEVEEDDAASLRRPANDITAKLKIDFGSLGRPSRGTRGRGGRERGGPATRPETVSPQKPPEKARVQQGQAPNPDDPEDFPALA